MRKSNRNGWQLDPAQAGPRSSGDQLKQDFATLCAAHLGEFTEALEAITQTVVHTSLCQEAGAPDPINQLLLPCFKVGSDLELCFEGDIYTAHQAMCLAAVLHHLGWNRLSTEAHIWATQLNTCNVPATLGSTGPMDIEKGRALMEHFVRHDFPVHLQAYADRKTQLVDPFIGM